MFQTTNQMGFQIQISQDLPLMNLLLGLMSDVSDRRFCGPFLFLHLVPHCITCSSKRWVVDGFTNTPLVNVYSLLLKMAIEIVDLPIKDGWMFHCFLYVYQRVSPT